MLATNPNRYHDHVERDVPAVMRDGVTLSADVWLPAGGARYPALIFRTPYGKHEGDPENERAFRAAVARGYAVVVQDVRGRYHSEGEFDPYRQEGPDGYDTVEWTAAQPWCDGNVGMFGLSYPGAAQWLAAVEAPPHLKAIVPAMSFSTARRFIYFGGVFDLSWVKWSAIHIAPDARARKGLPGARAPEAAQLDWDQQGDEALLGHLPLLDQPSLREAAPYYADWLRHPPGNPYWSWGDLAPRYGHVQAAVLNLSGWHDEPYGAQGAIDNFNGLRAARSAQPDPATQLWIGPWTHGVAATARASAGQRAFDANAAIDYDALVLDWLDHYVRGIERPVARGKPVHVYVMGANCWREMDAWPPREARLAPLYLRRDGAAASGQLDWAPAAGAASSAFVSDPAHPVQAIHDTNFGAFDLSYLAGRGDVLAFESAPLPDDLEVTGDITADVYVSSDTPDFDLYVMLLDVDPDGRAFNLMSTGTGIARALWQLGRLLGSGEVARLTFDNLRTSNCFLRGHRLRVVLCASWHPLYARNLQTGESEITGAAMRPATITIHHDERYPTRLHLPLYPRF
jgi:uncharacterized protein